jgi:predicted lipid-binding transport protein (Tim44 family)
MKRIFRSRGDDMKSLDRSLFLVLCVVLGACRPTPPGGGGKSFGRQSSNVTQRQATPPAPGAPAQQNATNSQPPSPRRRARAAAPKRPWGAMLGGLAAGLGLAWLAHTLGLGAGFGNILLIGLLVLAALVVVAHDQGALGCRTVPTARAASPSRARAPAPPTPARRAVQPGQRRQRCVGTAVGAQRHGLRRHAGRR